MTSADEYRLKAAEFSLKAKTEQSPERQIEFAKMAANYFRLAELADRNAATDVVYEPPFDQKPVTP